MVEIMSQMSEQEILKLPKNIRQIGLPEEKKKIYVEDYVVTYMNQLAEEHPNQQAAAILLGKCVKQKDLRLTFIHGAIGLPAAKVEDDRIVFDARLWEELYETMRNFFHSAEIIGWFLTRPGRSLGINEKITKIHVDHFPGKEKTLLLMDPIDKEEAFFIYEGGKLTRQQGYYIYYERNEEMQNYMVDQRKDKRDEDHLQAADIRGRERNYLREKNKERDKIQSFNKKSEKQSGNKRLAGTIVAALFLVVVGMNMMEKLYVPVDSTQTLGGQVIGETVTIEIPEETALTELESEKTEFYMESEESASASAVETSYIRYTVRKGDTLVNLCIGLYDSMEYVDRICELNGIDDPDLIYEGMVLELPEKR